MNDQWKHRAKAFHEKMENNGRKQPWTMTVNESSKKCLLDHLAFLFTKTTQTIITEKENQILREITEQTLKVENEEVYVLLIGTYIHINNTDYAVVPLITFRNKDNTSSALINHLGQSYSTWGEYEEKNISGQLCVCFPKYGMYYQGNNLCYFEKQSDVVSEHLSKAIETFKFNIDISTISALDDESFVKKWNKLHNHICAIFAQIASHRQKLNEYYKNDLQSKVINLFDVFTSKLIHSQNETDDLFHTFGNNIRTFEDKETLMNDLKLLLAKIEKTHKKIETFRETFRILFFNINFENITKQLVENINHQKKDLLNVILESFREITGEEEQREYLGNALFVKNIFYIILLSKNLDNLILHENKILEIKTNMLRLHPKALVQHHKDILLLIFKASGKKKYLTSKTRLVFDLQRQKQKQLICNALNVTEIGNFLLNNNSILENLKPFEADSLYLTMRDCLNFDPLKVKIGLEFAASLDCQNVDELCAALQYISIKLDQEEDVQKLDQEADKSQKQILENEIMQSFNIKKENYKSKFLKLKNDFEMLSNGHDLNFVSPFTAAYHYEKHVAKHGINLTKEEYLKYARFFAMHDVVFTWTQDGSSKCFNVDVLDVKAVRYEDNEITSAIATFYFKKGALTEDIKLYLQQNLINI